MNIVNTQMTQTTQNTQSNQSQNCITGNRCCCLSFFTRIWTNSEPHQSESYGLFLLLISALLFSIMGSLVKLASNTGIPSTELVFIRALFQGGIVFIGLSTQRQQQQEEEEEEEARNREENGTETDLDIVENQVHSFIKKVHSKETQTQSQTKIQSEGDCNGNILTSMQSQSKSPPKLLICNPFGTTRRVIRVVALRGLFGGLGFINYFFSIKTLPLGDAITLFSLYPIHTLFLAYFFLGERIRIIHIIATALSIVGAILIAGPSFLSLPLSSASSSSASSENDKDTNDNYNPLGYITAVLGSFLGATVIILIRKAGTLGVTATQLIFSWSIFSAMFSVFFGYVIFDNIEGQWIVPPSRIAWLYVIALCIIGSMAHFLLNYAGRISPAGISSIVRSSDIVFAYIGQVWVFDDIPTLYTIVGVIFVLSSVVIVAIQKYMDEKKNNMNENSNDNNNDGINDNDNDNNNDGINNDNDNFSNNHPGMAGHDEEVHNSIANTKNNDE